MLPVVDLDTETYEEILERARRMISGIYPQWTDYNEHDPGITFLQLLSWMKEMQQFHLDQIGNGHKEMYLKLLGMKRRRKKAAHALAEISVTGERLLIPGGTRLLAGDIPFETVREETAGQVELTECVCHSKDEERSVRIETAQAGGMSFFPFGEEPECGGDFEVRMGRPLIPGARYSLYFEIADNCPVRRNPIVGEFCPLVEISTEYYGEYGFEACETVKDGTDGFLHSGVIEFCVPGKMKPLHGQSYGIRFTLSGGEYDSVPVVQSVTANVIEVRQTYTPADFEDFCLVSGPDGVFEWELHTRALCEGKTEVYRKKDGVFLRVPEEAVHTSGTWDTKRIRVKTELEEGAEAAFRVVGRDGDYYQWEFDGTGFPYQEFDLNDRSLLYDRFEIMAEIPGRTDVWEEWRKVEDFYCSGPEDRHYCLDEEKGMLVFGDCEQGLAPEGRIRVIRCSRSLGREGNVRKGQIRLFENAQISAVPFNRKDAAGGEEKESIESCFARFRREFRRVDRAVTDQDYEKLVYETPGLRIARVKAVSTGVIKRGDAGGADNGISIVVRPYSWRDQAKLSEGYVKNIVSMLEQKRLLGTKVQVLSPEYIGVNVFADILVKPHYPAAREAVISAVEEYFAETVSGFGAVLEESGLYGILDAMECVEQVRNIALHAQGTGVRRLMNGSIQLPVNGLAYLRQTDYMITAGRT